MNLMGVRPSDISVMKNVQCTYMTGDGKVLLNRESDQIFPLVISQMMSKIFSSTISTKNQMKQLLPNKCVVYVLLPLYQTFPPKCYLNIVNIINFHHTQIIESCTFHMKQIRTNFHYAFVVFSSLLYIYLTHYSCAIATLWCI